PRIHARLELGSRHGEIRLVPFVSKRRDASEERERDESRHGETFHWTCFPFPTVRFPTCKSDGSKVLVIPSFTVLHEAYNPTNAQVWRALGFGRSALRG